jgi:two-component system chemotaxis response regulator CheY
MRALVIDDSRAMRAILAQTLHQLGFETTLAGNGQEGLDRLKEFPTPDLVMVDWNMRVMSGYEFIQAVRADPQWAGVRLVMVTTETDMPQMQAALAAGVDEYVMKPFTREAVREKLQVLGVVPA